MKRDEKMRKYEELVSLPYHQSKKYKHMPIKDRAAQFAPFAAVVGYDEEVKEIGRYTD